MTITTIIFLCAAIAVVAFLYSSVGHAGASGYIATMTLFGLAPAVIRPSALILNILVASLASWQFWRAGFFSWQLFWPFAALAVPLAFWGGKIPLPAKYFNILIGLVLLYSSARFFLTEKQSEGATNPPAKPIAMATGAGIGLLSGLTGTGGGIFLTPLMIFLRWAKTKETAAISALFILVVSIAGLLGNFSRTHELPSVALPVAAAALTGGAVGSYLGSQQFSVGFIKKLLAIVLTIAGGKLLLT